MKLKDRASMLALQAKSTLQTDLTILRSSSTEILITWPTGANVESPNLEACIQETFRIPDDLYFDRISSSNVGKLVSIRHEGLRFVISYLMRTLYIGVDDA